MSALPLIRRLFAHLEWADRRTLDALRRAGAPPPRALELFAHILGADHNWLARIEKRPPSAAIWPTPTVDECDRLMRDTHAAWESYIAGCTDGELERIVHYANSAGLEFDSRVEDILLHVCLHGSNHRGQVNALLRADGFDPQAGDYIAYVRGAPAATKDKRPS